MGISAREWTSLAEEAVEILGDPWHTVDKGLDTAIVRAGVQWRAQTVAFRPAGSLGSLVAYDGVLVRPLSATLARGDLGDLSESFHAPGVPRGASKFTPEGLALWTENVQRLVFERYADPFELLDFVESKTATLDLTGYTLQFRTGLRILCGVRTTTESLSDIDAVLADHTDTDETRIPVLNYYQELRELVAAEDRTATLEFINHTRLRTLTETFKIPTDLITNPPTYLPHHQPPDHQTPQQPAPHPSRK